MFMGPRNWFQGMDSASLCSLAGRYENPIPPLCLAPIDFLKIPAQFQVGYWPAVDTLRLTHLHTVLSVAVPQKYTIIFPN